MRREEWVRVQAVVDEVDSVAIASERKWGAGRLRLLVPLELRQKFDSQRVKLNDAIGGGSADQLATECRRMLNAYRALEAAAVAAGHKAEPEWHEIVGEDGVLYTFVRSATEVDRVRIDGFNREVWSLEEVVAVLRLHPDIGALKRRFGARLEAIKKAVEDPVPFSSSGKFVDDDLDSVNWTGEKREASAAQPAAASAEASGSDEWA